MAFGTRRWIELGIPGAEARLDLFTPPGTEAKIGTFTGLSFGTADIEKTYQAMLDRGVTFSKPLTKESWGSSAIFEDVDGNSFVLATE